MTRGLATLRALRPGGNPLRTSREIATTNRPRLSSTSRAVLHIACLPSPCRMHMSSPGGPRVYRQPQPPALSPRHPLPAPPLGVARSSIRLPPSSAPAFPPPIRIRRPPETRLPYRMFLSRPPAPRTRLVPRPASLTFPSPSPGPPALINPKCLSAMPPALFDLMHVFGFSFSFHKSHYCQSHATTTAHADTTNYSATTNDSAYKRDADNSCRLAT